MFLSSLFHPAYSSSSIRPLCRIDESSALLQFKESFIVNSTCGGPYDYPKVASWMLEGENNSCCLWDGVDCDDDTGHVIGLNLSSSCLYGSINSSSSLFRLMHLRQLDLSYNFFNYSRIPSTIGNLSMLTYLNLSYSFFQGQIPSEISLLYKLSVLDLSNNFNSYLQLLELKRPTPESLVQNLTNLEKLDLSVVDISSPVPNQLANIASLTALALHDCRLVGQFPIRILQLPNLQFLELWSNFDLKGYLPHLHLSSHLKYLSVGHTGFSGEIPASIGSLNSWERLDLRDCKFSGLIPPSLGNLSKLTILNLSGDHFREQTPSFFSNLSQLIQLSISSYNMSSGSLSWLNQLNKINLLLLPKNNLSEFPPSLANFTQLTALDLSSNDFTSRIPFWVFNLTKLVYLDFSLNKLSGAISSSISQLENLEYLDLFSNNLSGMVELDMLLRLKNLTALCVSLNKLSLLPPKNSNATLQKFMILGLASCNLSEFPNFLQNQDRLGSLDLSFNNIHGQIPQWFWKTSTKNLIFLDLSHNFLTGFSQTLVVLPWSRLFFLDISSNKLQGSLPIPQSLIFFYSISKNELTREISSLICSLNFLEVLDLSENNLSGKIPKCLGNFSNSLTILNLRRNNLHGTIPHTWTSGNKLRMIDVGDNKLRGQVPKSIVNCMLLENLDLGNNQINDSFPFWLATLPELKILILRSNYFHGPIAAPEFSLVFPKLRIFDISCNSITGSLPSN
ncbi:receptor-like protein 6 [Quercus lobata]|uniref:receptor-like protein 6 n=1 Tax=Quercus lobata TaxID=97700 RepID=UPI001248077F|nr:receptor-like protein 6 [Quercus lobata]